MAAIVITVPASGVQVNPTNLRIPFNRNGIFEDSPLQTPTTDELYCLEGTAGNVQGLSIDNRSATQLYKFGDIDNLNLGTIIILDPVLGRIGLDGTGIISATAGANSANHLVVYIAGVQYKIQLKNP